MLFFNNTRKNQWILRITDTEKQINSTEDLLVNLKKALNDVVQEKEEFVVLSPEKDFGHISFLQVCKDNNSLSFHIETGLNVKNSGGYNKVVCRDAVPYGAIENIFLEYYQNKSIDIKGWYELEMN